MPKNKTRAAQIAHIPAGPYCYTIRAITQDDAGRPVLHTHHCPHYRARRDADGDHYGHCRFLKAGDHSRHARATSLLFDSVKECDIHQEEEGEHIQTPAG